MVAESVDWSKLYDATSTSNQPTPGWLSNDLVRNLSYVPPAELATVAAYLERCVDGDHAHVKLKALLLIKAFAYRIPPFSDAMQDHMLGLHAATRFTGPPSPSCGDEPYRLVRDAAEGALDILMQREYYHQQYQQMSQRIVGFGNYQPEEDTVHVDGSINLSRDVTLKDTTIATAGFVAGGLLSLLSSVKDVVISTVGDVLAVEGGAELDDQSYGRGVNAGMFPFSEEELEGGEGRHSPDSDSGLQRDYPAASSSTYDPPEVVCRREVDAERDTNIVPSANAMTFFDLLGHDQTEPQIESSM